MILNSLLGVHSLQQFDRLLAVKRNLGKFLLAKEKQRYWLMLVLSRENRVVTAPYQNAEVDAAMAVAEPVSRSDLVVAALVTNIKVNTLTSFVSILTQDSQVWGREGGYILVTKYP